jgi:fibro-slime domain-containing protein
LGDINTQLYASTTYTDDNGDYQFVDVPMYGSFRICEKVPAGWHQTFPINENDNCHNYNTYASIAINSYDFGNQRDPQESVCGNQVKDDGEQCDDGNTVNGDGCSSTCQLETPQCTDQQSGWWSEYFNLPSNHPDVGAGDIPHFPYDDNTHGDPLGSWAPWTADWYDAQYYRFSRVDANLNFGDDFFPMDMIHEEVNPAWNNHDFFFAVHSRAKVTAPTTDDYSYMLRSDDDSWVYIDGVRFDDKDGIHPPATSGITEMPLTAGDHIIDVFYAERHPLGATLVMTLDDRLTVMPAPEHCNNLCGNQVKDRGEQCDDGNTVNGDGCNNKCQLETPECTDQQSGWWGEYYNYSINHPDMELDGTLWPDNGHGDPRSGSWNTDWYDDQYYRFSRVDSSLNYGDNYFPEDFLAEEISFGHEYHFGVHWRGKVTAPANDTYTYHLRTDDDSWVYVDNVLIDNEAGVHAPYTSPNTQMNLTAGDHIIDIYFAERHRLGSTMEFTLDERLPVTPAPEDCQQCTNPLDYNHDQAITLSDAVLFTTYYENHDIKADINGNGGVDYGDYLCSYTPIATALYQCPLVCAAVCGDHIVQQNLQEQCDDGNVNNGDGCNARCQTETNECEVPNPLDYNGDYELNASDAVTFTQYYSADDVKADVNNNDMREWSIERLEAFLAERERSKRKASASDAVLIAPVGTMDVTQAVEKTQETLPSQGSVAEDGAAEPPADPA